MQTTLPMHVKSILEPGELVALSDHVREVRRTFDWPGIGFHDAFNRWYLKNLPVLSQLHRRRALCDRVSSLVGMPVRPSYNFLSMYSDQGVCPRHTDRPPCAITLDVMVRTDATQRPWPLIIDDVEYVMGPGEGVLYSGTTQMHERKPMQEASDATYADLVFFHFVPEDWMGEVM